MAKVCFLMMWLNCRYTNLLELPRPKSTRFGSNSFSFQAVKHWNSLPEEARKITDFDSFRAFIKGGVVHNVGVPSVGKVLFKWLVCALVA